MVYVDLDSQFTPGIDLWEVVESRYTRGKDGTGEPRFALKFQRVSNRADELFDNLMMGGAGKRIGAAKLAVFVGEHFKGEVDPISFVGRRVWIETTIEQYNGEPQLKVNIGGLKHKGYQREEDVPPGKDLSLLSSTESDNTPF